MFITNHLLQEWRMANALNSLSLQITGESKGDILSLLGQVNASLPHPVVLRCKGAASPSLPNEPGYEMENPHNGPSALMLDVKGLHA